MLSNLVLLYASAGNTADQKWATRLSKLLQTLVEANCLGSSFQLLSKAYGDATPCHDAPDRCGIDLHTLGQQTRLRRADRVFPAAPTDISSTWKDAQVLRALCTVHGWMNRLFMSHESHSLSFAFE
jgi:hypothetical protein